MRHAVVALGALALLTTGCGGTTSSSPAASASSPTGSTSAGGPLQPTWTVEEAGQHYLAMTSQTIADINRLKGLPDSVPLAALTSGCGDVADDMVSMLSEAQSGHWPAQVQPLMEQWSKAVDEQRAFFAACSSAQTISDAQAALSPVAEHNSADESAQVRAALGLGPPQA
jgi:hypothetical protein